MTNRSVAPRTRLSLASSLAGLLALVACSACSKPDAPPAPPAPPAGSASAAAVTGPLKVAFVYVGPVGDAGWTFAHDRARKEAEAAFGDKVKTSFVENVPEAADAERVIRDEVSQGNTLIF